MSNRTSRRLAISVAVILGVGVGTGAGGSALAAPVPGPGQGPGPAQISVTLEACHNGADPASRYATFAAEMAAIPGSRQLSIRFDLGERVPGASGFLPIPGAPGTGVWKNSEPSVGIFGFSQEVSDLPPATSFRAVVSYRWMGAHHRVLRTARRTTPACTLPVLPARAAPGLVAGPLV